jgi:hypothetical protein
MYPMSMLCNPVIRQRLLENETLSLSDAHAQALELAQQHTMQYDTPIPTINAVSLNLQPTTSSSTNAKETTCVEQDPAIGAVRFNTKCYFYGGPRHLRINCPAKD